MERWIIKIKVHVLNWKRVPGDSLMVDIVKKNYEARTISFRCVHDGRTANLRFEDFEILSTGGDPMTQITEQGKLL